ncbi:MAG: PAS domain S-box protein [Nitrospirae bacterium]|nr:MAG: PAS domain S-box protein [Nitrospirota bacterium]
MTAALLVLISVLCIYILYRELSIRRLSDELEEILESCMLGEFNKRMFLPGRDRLSRVINRINNVAEITEQRIKKLEEEKIRWQSLLRGLSDAVLLVDEEDRVEIVNDTFLQEFNLKERDVRERLYSEAIREPVLIELIERARTTGLTQRGNIINEDTDRVFRATVYPVRLNHSTNIMVILRDITERKEVERLKRDFIANVSHELKTPITNIKGYVETLIEELSPECRDSLEFLRVIHKNTQRMERLVLDLIQLSSIESGAIRIEKREIGLKDFLKEVTEEFRKAAEQKGLAMSMSLEDEQEVIRADPLRLKQILSNLIDNAIKFTEKGSVVVGAFREDSLLILFVQDTGIGIPKKYIPRLGERFFRVDPSRSRELGGTGLGLAIVKHLVNAHGWRMEIESREASGTRVSIIVSEDG